MLSSVCLSLHFRENMSKYALEVRKVATEIMGAITESLGLGPNYMTEKLEEGMQVIVSNFYPPCEEREAALGLAPHSDFGCITILLQNHHGLEIMDPEDGTWRMVPELPGALQVHVGDHLEVLSNGLYKSVIHRATLNSEKTRLSIASLHSLAMDEMIDIAKELVDDKHPRGYRGSTFREFLKFISTNDITKGSFIESLKIKK
uniref:Fe2OG dioxygenase domain-containing protein n=1 Tax=Nelumbo nucifera TaxID=4432 RepID=A0A822ZWP7_NELNU|nr:TPA_asm: hypothetical protein HUJ06_017606 [Nelumbo nucifera]